MQSNSSDEESRGTMSGDPTYILLPITVLYSLIFVAGLFGNISTCVVISRNKHMHTATNYYLFSLAISDLLLLLSGMPPEVYLLWVKTYVFGETFCILTGFAAETCANATVLTITAFTVERYVAICHPFLSQTVSKLSRAVKSVIVIWLAALFLAVPQAIQFGVVRIVSKMPNSTVSEEALHCTLVNTRPWLKYSFQISTLVFFVAPMSLITGLYLLIGVKLRRSRLIKRPHSDIGAQKRVIRMLVAVVVCFFICWAPFHAQRLLAVHAAQKEPSSALVAVYKALTHVSGVLYYLSTTVNPLLYNIMSRKFREAFKNTLAHLCGKGRVTNGPMRTYSVLSRANTQLVRADDDKRKLRQSAPLPATISNSSLQDAGVQEEYSGAELASYMGQLNTR